MCLPYKPLAAVNVQATAHFSVSSSQAVAVSVELSPLDIPGHLRLQGVAQLPSSLSRKLGGSGAAPGIKDTTTSVQHTVAASSSSGSSSAGPRLRPGEDCDVHLSVKDGGMALLTSLVPDCDWQAGSASIDIHAHGKLEAPAVEGAVDISKGMIASPLLKHPVTGVSAAVKVGSNPQLLRLAQIGTVVKT